MREILKLTALPETNSSPLKMDGWKTFSFPFGAGPMFRGELLLLWRVRTAFLGITSFWDYPSLPECKTWKTRWFIRIPMRDYRYRIMGSQVKPLGPLRISWCFGWVMVPPQIRGPLRFFHQPHVLLVFWDFPMTNACLCIFTYLVYTDAYRRNCNHPIVSGCVCSSRYILDFQVT